MRHYLGGLEAVAECQAPGNLHVNGPHTLKCPSHGAVRSLTL